MRAELVVDVLQMAVPVSPAAEGTTVDSIPVAEGDSGGCAGAASDAASVSRVVLDARVGERCGW